VRRPALTLALDLFFRGGQELEKTRMRTITRGDGGGHEGERRRLEGIGRRRREAVRRRGRGMALRLEIRSMPPALLRQYMVLETFCT